ncbi:S24 family peptidase [Candidatus Kapabacteria bacterium]|nr:S24 family peptidase [Candidatus Kapabacteria bacterium]
MENIKMVSPGQQIIRNINRLSYSSSNLDNLFLAKKSTKKLPLFERPKQEEIKAKYSKLDLNEYLIKDPESTFLIRVQGDSMNGAGINTGNIIVVDRLEEVKSGQIVVAAINGDLLVKKLIRTNEGTELHSANKNYPTIQIDSEDSFDIWGVVKSVIKPV